VLLLLRPKSRLWDGCRNLIRLPGEVVASLGGFSIISPSTGVDVIGRGRNRVEPLPVENNRHRTRTIIGVSSVDEAPEALTVSITGFLRRGAA
jgi:hypothetical protein